MIDIRTPALAEHKEDIAPLVSKFIREFSAENGGTVKSIDAKALKLLEDYSWPGNVRQLRNTVEKMVVLASGDRLTAEDVPEELSEDRAFQPSTPPPLQPSNPPQPSQPSLSGATLAEQEKAQILAVLADCKNNKSKAALRLGISRRTLHRKLNEWSLT